MDKSKFVKSFKMLKSRPILKGHKLTMYGTQYDVMDTNDKLTLLKDPQGNPCAYPTKKLNDILRKECMKSLAKAENPTATPAQSSKGGSPDVGKMHAGMIRVDKVDSKGRKYHYWVHAETGMKHDDHSSKNPSGDQIDHASQQLHSKVLTTINMHASAGDHEKLKSMLDDWVHAKASYHNLKEAQNQMIKENGGKIPTSVMDKLATMQSNHEKKYKALKQALVDSVKKVKGAKSE